MALQGCIFLIASKAARPKRYWLAEQPSWGLFCFPTTQPEAAVVVDEIDRRRIRGLGIVNSEPGAQDKTRPSVVEARH
jgi:hypothetical protein